MEYTEEFILTCMENSYLDFENLRLTNDELDKFIITYDDTLVNLLIKQINISGNNISHYDIRKILNVFRNAKEVITSNINAIDCHDECNQISILVV